MAKGLSGVRVLDFTRILAGPYCTMLLGDLGADVIKIERPGTGDDTRAWRPPSVGDQSCYFLSVNRNKKSVALDLKSEKGVSIARKLAAKSDIVVENFLPGAMKKLGLSYGRLADDNAGLIYCSITGYGPTGPYKQRGGYDVIAAAIGGLLSITGEQDGPPCKPGVAMTDIATGLYAKGAILMALLERTQTGKGQKIDCNLLTTEIAGLVNISTNYLNTGLIGTRYGTAHESIVPYQRFPTKDGHIIIGAANDSLFVELCQLVSHPDLASDLRFATNADRVHHRGILVPLLEEIFMSKTNAEWSAIFDGSRLPYGPVNNIEQVFADPQVQHLKVVERVPHPTMEAVSLVGPAVKFSHTPNCISSHPPLLGEHTAQVLTDVLELPDVGYLYPTR